MPRKNKRKKYTTGKESALFSYAGNTVCKPECIGCAFAGYGYICTTSDGTCLKSVQTPAGQSEAGNAKYNR